MDFEPQNGHASSFLLDWIWKIMALSFCWERVAAHGGDAPKGTLEKRQFL